MYVCTRCAQYAMAKSGVLPREALRMEIDVMPYDSVQIGKVQIPTVVVRHTCFCRHCVTMAHWKIPGIKWILFESRLTLMHGHSGYNSKNIRYSPRIAICQNPYPQPISYMGDTTMNLTQVHQPRY